MTRNIIRKTLDDRLNMAIADQHIPGRHRRMFLLLLDQDWCRRSGDECAAIYKQDCMFFRRFRVVGAGGGV